MFYAGQLEEFVNNNGKKNPMLFLQYYFCFGILLKVIFSNYGKNWATLFKPQLSSYPGSDFIVHYFVTVKIDFDR